MPTIVSLFHDYTQVVRECPEQTRKLRDNFEQRQSYQFSNWFQQQVESGERHEI